MKYRLLFVLAALPADLYSQTPQREKWNTLERMCGRVTDSEFSGTPWSTSYLLGPGKPKKADVLLYRREGKKKCCAQNALVSEVPTESDGGFEFKDAVPGQYWVVVVVRKKKYKLAVSLLPRDGKPSQECSDSVFQIKEDELQLQRLYHLK
jgi:hypothetical protein